MASVLLSPVGNSGQIFTDNNGVPLAGGLIYTYQAGSSSPLATYTSNNGTTANANPIVLDANGRVSNEVWLLTGYSYKFIIQTATGTSLQTLDNIYPILQNAPASAPAVPSGGIILWSGSTGSVPSGWYLCDGTNGTPDLRNSFIVGAGNTYAVGATGGSADAVVVTHTHTATSVVTDPGHTHNAYGHSDNYAIPGGGQQSIVSYTSPPAQTTPTASSVTSITVATTNANTGTSGTNANLPPYYALAYIQKA